MLAVFPAMEKVTKYKEKKGLMRNAKKPKIPENRNFSKIATDKNQQESLLAHLYNKMWFKNLNITVNNLAHLDSRTKLLQNLS